MAATHNVRHPTQAPASPKVGTPRQAYHHPHTSLGATGHWIKTAVILAPLVIGEVVKDAEQRWRYIRIASIATALISEGMWTNKIKKERQEAREYDDLASMPM